MKDIVTLKHFPAVGAPSSVGMIFLGPFYYYLVAPWLLLFNFSPLGPAVGVATLSLIGVVAVYFAVKDLFHEKVAMLASIYFLFANVVVELSRFSWNPNLLVFFSMLSSYFLIKATKTSRWIFFCLAGLFLSFSMQLHYVMLALFLPFGLWLIYYILVSKHRFTALKETGMFVLAFLTGSLPLIIFDIRHQFLNVKNFINYIAGPKSTSSIELSEIIHTFAALNSHLFGFEISFRVALVIFILLAIFSIWLIKRKDAFGFYAFSFFVGLVVTSYFTRDKYVHYFGALYGLYFIVLAYIGAHVLWTKKREILLAVALFLFLVLQSQQYYFLHGTPNNQIQKGERVAKIILDNVTAEKYQITGVPDMYDDNIYRYFLDLWGKKPLEKDSLEKGDELFAICEAECSPLEAPQWSVTFFAPTEIVQTWKSESVTIYKLVR